MRRENSSNSSDEQTASDLESAFSREDLARLFNYPSIGQLFSEKEPRGLEDFFAKLTATNENLERIVRYGNQTEAEKAARAARSVKITIEFLRKLQAMQTAEIK